MTRRGSLAYYLAAWVIGGFVVAVGFWWSNGGNQPVSEFLMAYFFALVAGPVDLVLFAFLLRRAMRWSGTQNAAAWAVIGAALFFTLLAVLTAVSANLPGGWDIGTPRLLANLLFDGPQALLPAGFWPAPVEGAAAAIVLCWVDRAFDRPVEPEMRPQLGPALGQEPGPQPTPLQEPEQAPEQRQDSPPESQQRPEPTDAAPPSPR